VGGWGVTASCSGARYGGRANGTSKVESTGFYRPTGRPKRTSLPLECHRNAINRNHFGSSARHSTKA
jgi:hypothetical protein